jgi:hypothetical protein
MRLGLLNSAALNPERAGEIRRDERVHPVQLLVLLQRITPTAVGGVGEKRPRRSK